MNIILSILCNYRYLDDDLMIAILKFLNVLLLKRNQNVQRTIKQFFFSYRKSEVLFEKMDSIFQKWISVLRGEDSKKMHSDTKKKLKKQCNLLLNFIQLSTEGHYLDL